MKFLSQKKILQSVVYSFFCLFLFEACSNKKVELEKAAEKAVASDIKQITTKTLDGFTNGVGSFILDFVVAPQKQDSLLIDPIRPYIEKELHQKNESELATLAENKNERYKFMANVLLNNKDEIAKNMSKNFIYAEKFIDYFIQFIQDNKGKFSTEQQ